MESARRAKEPRSLREVITDHELRQRIQELWRKAKRFHDRQTSPDRSDNGTTHCAAVDQNILRLIRGAGKLDGFSACELFLLSAAACCHDFDRGLPPEEKARLARELEFGPDAADLEHAYGSGRFVVDAAGALGLEDEEAEWVDKVVRHHDLAGRLFCDALDEFSEMESLHGSPINPRRAAVLVKVADAIQVQNRLRKVDFGGAATAAQKAPDDLQTRRRYTTAVFRYRARDWSVSRDAHTITIPCAPRDYPELSCIRESFDRLGQEEIGPVAVELRAMRFPWRLELRVDPDYLPKPEAPAGRPEGQPIPGFYSYGPEDAAIFRGREEDIGRLEGLVLTNRYVLLTGLSGVGKSSLIQAGLAPVLESSGHLVVVTRPNPDKDLLFHPSDFVRVLDVVPPDSTLTSLCVDLAQKAAGGTVLLALDQFEDVAYYGRLDADHVALELAAASKAAPRVHFLISYRDDVHTRLLGVWHQLTGTHSLPPQCGIHPLDEYAAKEALRALMGSAQVYIEDEEALYEAVMEDLKQASTMAETTHAIYPPFIQMIAARLIQLGEKPPVTVQRYQETIEVGGEGERGTEIVTWYLHDVLTRHPACHSVDREREGEPMLLALCRTTSTKRRATAAEVGLVVPHLNITMLPLTWWAG